MNLTIDIGNTVAKVAVFDGGEPVEVLYDAERSFACLPELVKRYSVRRGILSTVVDLPEAVRSRLQASGVSLLWLDSEVPVPIVNLYKTKHTLGTDRLAAVVGAACLAPEKDCLVIDAGTCVTYDFIDAAGNYHGGNISPGVNMRLKALHNFTGKLPLVAQEGEMPHWGDTTETAIRAGVVQGLTMEIEGYIERERRKCPDISVFLTGGDEFPFDKKIKNTILADRFLVLRGLNRILEYNNDRLS